MMHKIMTGLRWLVGIFLCMCVMMILVPPFFEVYPNVVLSGSMEPQIPVGSLAYISKNIPPSDIKEKDIIAFELMDGRQIMHRVAEVYSEADSFKTKGDANDTEDLGAISFRQYRGRYLLCIPFAGYIIHFLCSKYVIVSALLVCIALLAVDFWCDRKEQKKRAVCEK